MSLTDIFSSSFLLCVTVIVIMIGGMFAYVNFRMSEQDHKFKSMMELISAYAIRTETAFVNLGQLNSSLKTCEDNINLLIQDDTKKIKLDTIEGSNNLAIRGGLIEVSDSEDDEDNEAEDDEDDDEDDDDEDDDKVVLSINDAENVDITVIKIDDDIDDVTDDEVEIDDASDDSSELDINNFLEETNTIGYESIEFSQVPDSDTDMQIQIQMHSEPTVEEIIDKSDEDINNATKMVQNEIDYKKMSINKLREIVIEKGLISDASKLKKNELLKVLDAH